MMDIDRIDRQKDNKRMIITSVGRRGYVTIPSALRRQIGLKEGDRVALVPQGDHIILRPITQTLLDLRGSVPVSKPQDFSDIRGQVIRERAQRGSHNE